MQEVVETSSSDFLTLKDMGVKNIFRFQTMVVLFIMFFLSKSDNFLFINYPDL